MAHVAVFAGLLTGCLLMIYAGMTEISYLFHVFKFLEFSDHVNVSLITWFIVASKLGCLVGSIFFGVLADIVGRKRTITLIYLPLVISSIIFQATSNYETTCGASFIAGLSVGGTYAVTPIYTGEIATKDVRGRLISILYICHQLGNVLVILGKLVLPFLSEIDIASLKNYVCVFLAISGILLTETTARESPYYFISKGKEELARINLKYLRRFVENPDLEFEEMQSDIKHMKTVGTQVNGVYLPHILWLKPLFLMLGVYFFSYVVYVFPSHAFLSVSESTWNPLVTVLLTSLLPCMGSFLTLFMVDKLGRKPTLMISFTGLFLVSAVFLIGNLWKDYFANVNLLLYILFNTIVNIGVGPIPVVLLGEIFPLAKKGIFAGISTALLFVFQLCVLALNQTIFSDKTKQPIDIHISMAILVAGVIITRLCYVETRQKNFKGNSIES